MNAARENRVLTVVSTARVTTRTSSAAGMTDAEIDQLPASMDFPTACRALGIGQTLGYALHKRREFPTPVLRLGKRTLRVMKADLLVVLRGQHTA